MCNIIRENLMKSLEYYFLTFQKTLMSTTTFVTRSFGYQLRRKRSVSLPSA